MNALLLASQLLSVTQNVHCKVRHNHKKCTSLVPYHKSVSKGKGVCVCGGGGGGGIVAIQCPYSCHVGSDLVAK